MLCVAPFNFGFYVGFFFHKRISFYSEAASGCTKGVLKNFAKCTGKDLCQSLFFIKLALQLY